ncbi:MAG TPA: serine hydrolase domain-containing protein, partial [Cryptosporangiaceae bacterium]|nr:serine hydrolase domain-containing protein [Cryptosporangiaceae bacterium]
MNPIRFRALAMLSVTALLGGVLGGVCGPEPTRLNGTTTGDAALTADVRAAVADPDGYRGLAVARIEPAGTVRFAGLGETTAGTPVDRGTTFEIGSVAKTFTGALLADAVSRGEVRPETTLAEALPDVRFTDPELARTTLAQLASHRGGVPRLAGGLRAAFDGLAFELGGDNPYGRYDTPALLAVAATTRVGDSTKVQYSNLGVALLGQALARRAGAPYHELLRTRLFEPLGMDASVVAPVSAPRDPAGGQRAGGAPVQPWTGLGYAPAGVGTWSTAVDMAALLRAVAAGNAPGADAAKPRWAAGEDRRIGYAWFTDRHGGQEVTWHNGATGGSRSWVGFDRASGRGVVVLGNTDQPVDEVGLHLLGVRTEEPADGTPLWLTVVVLALLAVGAGGLLSTSW